VRSNKKQAAAMGGYFLSPLRYPGGKGRLGPWLSEVVAANNLEGGCYVEPYAGGAGAALYLLFQGFMGHIVINDADPVVHAFWVAVTQHSDELVERIAKTRVSLAERERQLTCLAECNRRSTVDLAFAAFFLNRTSRSGILSGGVIGGKAQSGPYLLNARYNKRDLIARIRAIAKRKDQITVLGLDALDVLLYASPGFPEKSLIYLDPPYYAKGSQLYRNHYTHEDHTRIAWWVRQTSRSVLVTYDNCPEIRALYSGVAASKFSLHYSTHLTRPKATELLFHANLALPNRPILTRSSLLESSAEHATHTTTGVS
jgi:DNA adenine methylase